MIVRKRKGVKKYLYNKNNEKEKLRYKSERSENGRRYSYNRSLANVL
jgi:hypothetical protein